ncbi:hypothetical protein [Streptomyces gardneri]|uniref:hypothetical protein n=1 Tax=Streptomyces gardneri TaxID=66892 RepID=UPI0035E27E37
MHSGDITSPADRLRLLQDEYLTPRAGHRAERTATTTEPSTPIRLAVFDHIRASVTEAVETVVANREGNTAPTQPPNDPRLVYRWMVEETADLDASRQQVIDSLMYRQGLQHAIVMGDTDIIRRHPCPSCVTWGLVWDDDREQVVCPNRYCADDYGQPTTWTLAQIAEDHIARKNHRAARAT